MLRIKPFGILVVGLLLSLATSSTAQQETGSANARPASRGLRWLEAQGAARYIFVENRGSRVRMDDLQYKLHLKGQLRLDRRARTYLQFRVETGSSFQPSWNFSGWGRNDSQQSLSVKDLFLSQKLGSRWELQAGGIEFDQGSGSEATWADVDGFQVGYRVGFAPQRPGWPDRVQVTVSRIGEFQHPSVFARLPGMRHPNSVQVLLEKKLVEGLQVSGEYDRIEQADFARFAIRWKPARWLDRVVVEAIARTSQNPSLGYSVQFARTVKRAGPCTLTLTYSHMERGVFDGRRGRLLLNGDQPNLGQRFLFQAARPLPGGFTLTGFVSRQLDNTISVPRHDRWRAQLVVSYRFTPWLNARVPKPRSNRNGR